MQNDKICYKFLRNYDLYSRIFSLISTLVYVKMLHGTKVVFVDLQKKTVCKYIKNKFQERIYYGQGDFRIERKEE